MTTLARLVVRKQVSVFGGPASGTKYDLTLACKVCGTGAEQIGPLVLRGLRSARFRMFSTLDDEILCDADLAKAIEDHGLGHCLEYVVDAKRGTPLTFRQLRVQATLPRFSSESSGLVREKPCRECDRDGYFGIPRVPPALCYADLGSRLLEHDLLATWERFGNSRLREPFSESVFAAPLLIVGERFRRLLESEQLPGIEFEPTMVK